MPIETITALPGPKGRALDDPRVRRILRFVVAVTLATAYSTYIQWSYSHLLITSMIANVATTTLAPSVRNAAWSVIRQLSFYALGAVLMLPLHNEQLFGLALVGLILFAFFYLQAQGKMGPANAKPFVLGVTLLPAIGAVSMDRGIKFLQGQAKNLYALFPILWLAFAVLPQGVSHSAPKAPRVEGSSVDRAIVALRPVALVLPLFVFMLSSENNTRYLIGYYQVALISQHAGTATSRKVAEDTFMAAIIGCTAGVVLWWLLKLWPSWFWVVLMMALFSLFFATRIFGNGPGGLTPHSFRWWYGLSTMVLITLKVAATEYDFTSDDPDMLFHQRILDYAFITAYALFGILVFNTIVERLRAWRGWPARNG